MATTGPINFTLELKPKWWMRPAFWLAWGAINLGLVRDKPSPDYIDGMMPAGERAAKWLADYAFRVEARFEGVGG